VIPYKRRFNVERDEFAGQGFAVRCENQAALPASMESIREE
jgi:hypothetical protein